MRGGVDNFLGHHHVEASCPVCRLNARDRCRTSIGVEGVSQRVLLGIGNLELEVHVFAEERFSVVGTEVLAKTQRVSARRKLASIHADLHSSDSAAFVGVISVEVGGKMLERAIAVVVGGNRLARLVHNADVRQRERKLVGTVARVGIGATTHDVSEFDIVITVKCLVEAVAVMLVSLAVEGDDARGNHRLRQLGHVEQAHRLVKTLPILRHISVFLRLSRLLILAELGIQHMLRKRLPS